MIRLRFIAVLCDEIFSGHSRSPAGAHWMTPAECAKTKVAVEAASLEEARSVVKARIPSRNVVVVAAVEGFDDSVPMLIPASHLAR